MSADPSMPDDLVRWLERNDRGGPDTFVARRDFRRYIQEHLSAAEGRAAAGSLQVRAARARAIDVVEATCRSGWTHQRYSEAPAPCWPSESATRHPEPFADFGAHPAWVADP